MSGGPKQNLTMHCIWLAGSQSGASVRNDIGRWQGKDGKLGTQGILIAKDWIRTQIYTVN